MLFSQMQFEELHKQYRDRLVYSLSRFVRNRDEAEDIASSAFAAAWSKQDAFRGDSALYTWVHAIAINEAKYQRRKKPTESLDAMDNFYPRELIVADNCTRNFEQAEQMAQLHRALAAVPDRFRRALMDYFVCGHSVKKMAKRSQIPVGTVLSRIFASKQALRKAWNSGA